MVMETKVNQYIAMYGFPFSREWQVGSGNDSSWM